MRSSLFRGLSFAGLVLAGLLAGAAAQASSTLRVGSRVLVAGDSAARAVELLGRPSHVARRRAGRRGRRGGVAVAVPAGERWQYRRGGHTVVLTIVDGAVADIDDRRD
ncbi:hypothetical protein ASG87_10435 [Frateuria sp. Soil773]|uniref:DUF2845 domain-containing protein n=1 Tax=Frateuria sp. Soil773 TaxID=1736407 RepID=UPI0006F7BC0C|nr:DUF2845 domain-containing protein [Frateuria sp. Soil773]KRF01914.1 hypothetical protein ASG87_10435 [Frateuria sp. Soil773]